MAESADSTGVESLENETPTQRQARLRREKRQKKMTEQGEDRLAKIKALNGGVAPSDEVLGGPTVPAPSTPDDPDEVDISASGGFMPAKYPQQQPGFQQQDLLRQLSQAQQPPQPGLGAGLGQDGAEDDPMMRMMQQMMGVLGGGQPGTGPNGEAPQVPPALQALMKSVQEGGGGAGAQGQQGQRSSKTALLWKIVHVVFAVSLGVYLALTSTFNGSKLMRAQTAFTTDESQFLLGPRLVVLFTSAELVLQSTKYFLEGGELQGGGILASITNSGVIPPPYNNYIRIAGRYVGIALTIFTDVMTLVFVFGCVALWRGATAPISLEI